MPTTLKLILGSKSLADEVGNTRHLPHDGLLDYSSDEDDFADLGGVALSNESHDSYPVSDCWDESLSDVSRQDGEHGNPEHLADAVPIAEKMFSDSSDNSRLPDYNSSQSEGRWVRNSVIVDTKEVSNTADTLTYASTAIISDQILSECLPSRQLQQQTSLDSPFDSHTLNTMVRYRLFETAAGNNSSDIVGKRPRAMFEDCDGDHTGILVTPNKPWHCQIKQSQGDAWESSGGPSDQDSKTIHGSLIKHIPRSCSLPPRPCGASASLTSTVSVAHAGLLAQLSPPASPRCRLMSPYPPMQAPIEVVYIGDKISRKPVRISSGAGVHQTQELTRKSQGRAQLCIPTTLSAKATAFVPSSHRNEDHPSFLTNKTSHSVACVDKNTSSLIRQPATLLTVCHSGNAAVDVKAEDANHKVPPQGPASSPLAYPCSAGYSQNRAWVSPSEQEFQRFLAAQKRWFHMGFAATSPFLPTTFNAYLAIRTQTVEEEKSRVLRCLARLKKEGKLGVKCLGGRTFDDGRSAILALDTMWCRWLSARELEEARGIAWPKYVELKHEGDERAAAHAGRSLPVPRESRIQGLPMIGATAGEGELSWEERPIKEVGMLDAVQRVTIWREDEWWTDVETADVPEDVGRWLLSDTLLKALEEGI